MVLSAIVVIAYVIATRPNGLEGDQAEYHQSAVFFSDGKPFWSTLPFGIPHPSMAKAPGYPAWIGSVYTILGPSPTKLGIVQGLIFAPLGVLGTWLLARRLFGDPVAAISAFVVALFPLVWEYYGLLYPEVLAVPLTTFTFWLFLERQPSWKLAAGIGAVVGVGLLVRPTAGFLFAGIAAAWIISAGWKRGAAYTAATIATAALIVLPWTVRNMLIEGGGFVPISYQDAAGFGTFNDEAANDPVYPYGWRPFLADPPDVLEGPPVSDYEVRSELQADAFDYIGDHPFSVAEAFYWNGSDPSLGRAEARAGDGRRAVRRPIRRCHGSGPRDVLPGPAARARGALASAAPAFAGDPPAGHGTRGFDHLHRRLDHALPRDARARDRDPGGRTRCRRRREECVSAARSGTLEKRDPCGGGPAMSGTRPASR